MRMPVRGYVRDTLNRFFPRPHNLPPPATHAVEIGHWNEIENVAATGERIFWLNHPRVAKHYYEKALLDGLRWQAWIPRALGRPANTALELGCGKGDGLASLWRAGAARGLVGVDLDETRFAAARARLADAGDSVRFVAQDINHIHLEPSTYDLIYAIQSFHHFENLEHLFAEIYRALTPGGYCVLDEYAGPARFQWTDAQLALTRQLLGLLPRDLRIYRNGIEKREEGRSSVEQVVAVCPSEAIRSGEIVPLFHKTFADVQRRNLGGTIQHLLYSGIVHNFPDNDEPTDHLIDCIDGLERVFIDYRIVPSDFVLLIGRKPGKEPR